MYLRETAAKSRREGIFHSPPNKGPIDHALLARLPELAVDKPQKRSSWAMSLISVSRLIAGNK